jgi:hypothetical protein
MKKKNDTKMFTSSINMNEHLLYRIYNPKQFGTTLKISLNNLIN